MEQEEGAVKNKLIEDDANRHIYYKGAFVIVSPHHTNWVKDSENLQRLKPVPAIQSILDEVEAKCGGATALSRFVGVHIRDRQLDTDIDGVDTSREYGDAAVKVINHWRSRSSFRNFVPKMLEMLEDDPGTKFFVSCDTISVLQQLQESLPDGTVVYIPRSCDERIAECMQYAVADVFTLSKTKTILGSQWSSFTEAAQRLSRQAPVYLAGRDFAVAKEDKREAEEWRRKQELRAAVKRKRER